jgi:hypothetical protein
MRDPTTDSVPTELELAASVPLTASDLLLGVGFFAGICLVNGLIAILAISLLQGAGIWEAATEGGSVVDDLLGERTARFGLALCEARA